MRKAITYLLPCFLFFFTFLQTLGARADSFYVGNGGEGIQVDQNVYDRDLFDYGFHTAPWFGPNVDNSLLKQLVLWNPLQLSSQEITLLATKLTDLNSVRPFLGDDLLAVLQFFRWQLTDQDLLLINPDEIRVQIDNQARVPIANRFLQSILVNQKNLSRLDSKNKIALILHEAFFALMKVRISTVDQSQYQSLAATRQIVAFSFDQAQMTSTAFTQLLEDLLSIDPIDDTGISSFVRPQLANEKPNFNILLYTVTSAKPTMMILWDDNQQAQVQKINSFCRKSILRPFYVDGLHVGENAQRSIQTIVYQTVNRINQYSLKVTFLNDDLSDISVPIDTVDECNEYLMQTLKVVEANDKGAAKNW